MAQQETVLEWLERSREPLPAVLTVDRTMNSKYLFMLVVRHYRKMLVRRPQFLTYRKSEVNLIKGMLEEHSVFGDKALYVLEGFAYVFVESLVLPKDVYVVAETDGGDLKVPAYSHRLRRDILKVLLAQLQIRNLSLRTLAALDWTSCRDFGDYEMMLRKAKVMGWDEEEIGKNLSQYHSGPILTLTKRSQFKEVFSMAERYGSAWVINHVVEVVNQVVHWKALKLLGYDDDRAARELELGYYRAKELEETARALANEELVAMAARVVGMDRLLARNKELGLALLLLNSSIRISK